MNEFALHIFGFIAFYAFALWICVIFSRIGSEERFGLIKSNKALELFLMYRIGKYDGKMVPFYSLLQLAALYFGVFKFIIDIATGQVEISLALRFFAGAVAVTFFIGFFGQMICYIITAKREQKKFQNGKEQHIKQNLDKRRYVCFDMERTITVLCEALGYEVTEEDSMIWAMQLGNVKGAISAEILEHEVCPTPALQIESEDNHIYQIFIRKSQNTGRYAANAIKDMQTGEIIWSVKMEL